MAAAWHSKLRTQLDNIVGRARTIAEFQVVVRGFADIILAELPSLETSAQERPRCVDCGL